MSGIKMVGIVLIAAGILGLGYRGFSYTQETHETKIGPLELSVDEKQTAALRSGSVSAHSWLAVSC